MSAVETARGWVDELIRSEARCPGDTQGAMRRVASKAGVPYSALWSLRYRPPKDMMVSIYLKIQQALEAERERQLKRLVHEIEVTKAITGAENDRVRAAEALVRAAMGEADALGD